MSKLATPFSSVMGWFRTKDRPASSAASANVVDDQEEVVQRKRETNLLQMKRGYDDVVDLIETCKSHMDHQAKRADRLIDLMEGLPEAIKTLPESARQQAEMIEGLRIHLESQNANTERLADAVTGLSGATKQHEQALSMIQAQLDTSHESTKQMLSSFNTIGQTMGKMGDAHQSGNELLRNVADHVKQSDGEMRALFDRNQKQMQLMSVISWALAIGALGVAGFVGLKVSTASSAPAAAPIAAPAAAPVATPEVATAAPKADVAAPAAATPAKPVVEADAAAGIEGAAAVMAAAGAAEAAEVEEAVAPAASEATPVEAAAPAVVEEAVAEEAATEVPVAEEAAAPAVEAEADGLSAAEVSPYEQMMTEHSYDWLLLNEGNDPNFDY